MANYQILFDDVCYYMRKPTEITNLKGEKIIVRPTFPYNPKSKTTPETAKRWAGQDSELITRSNNSFSVTIVDLVARSEGGRAYKVIDDDNRLFDLREDQLIEAITIEGIDRGGKIGGSFVWGSVGGQTKMLLVDGDLHKEVVVSNNIRRQIEQKESQGLCPTPSSLVRGRVYTKKNGDSLLFLGRVKFDTFDDKVNYTFVELPVCPTRLLLTSAYGSVSQVQIEAYNRVNAIVDKWDQLTWLERRNELFDLTFPGNSHCRYYYEKITLLNSPKFVAEESMDATDLAEAIINQPIENLDIYDGYGENIPEKFYAKIHGSRESFRSDYGCYDRFDYKQWEIKRKQEIADWHKTFMSKLVWL